MPRFYIKNQILRRLSEQDFIALSPLLTPVSLLLKQVLLTPDEPVSHVYFIESGMVSLMAEAADSHTIEVGLIGFEGLTDQVLEKGDTAFLRTVVQLSGSAMAVEADAYVDWINDRPSALKLIARCLQALAAQTAHTALAHGGFTIEERLARLLLMCFDRNDGQDILLVHGTISLMLGVRRSGVTTSMHLLEGHGAIKNSRGRIQLRDRDLLIGLANGSYGGPEREYARLLGPMH